MPSIKVKENEPFDVALRRFKRSCEKAGLIAEVRKREHYEKPTTIRKRAACSGQAPRQGDAREPQASAPLPIARRPAHHE